MMAVIYEFVVRFSDFFQVKNHKFSIDFFNGTLFTDPVYISFVSQLERFYFDVIYRLGAERAGLSAAGPSDSQSAKDYSNPNTIRVRYFNFKKMKMKSGL
jgi:hypothetical protein